MKPQMLLAAGYVDDVRFDTYSKSLLVRPPRESLKLQSHVKVFVCVCVYLSA